MKKLVRTFSVGIASFVISAAVCWVFVCIFLWAGKFDINKEAVPLASMHIIFAGGGLVGALGSIMLGLVLTVFAIGESLDKP